MRALLYVLKNKDMPMWGYKIVVYIDYNYTLNIPSTLEYICHSQGN